VKRSTTPAPTTERFGAQVLELIEPIEEKTDALAVKADALAVKTDALAKELEIAMRTIKELEERERERNETRTRKARITRAANSAGMSLERWLAYCKKHGRDPERYLEKKLKAPRYR
jgi:predicted HicB family RNase H-like nuclease